MRKKAISNQWILLFFSVLSLSYLLVFFDWPTQQFSLIAGDDFSFHLSRMFNMVNDIKQTGWPSYVAEFGISQVVYGLNFFYPFLTTILPLAYGAVALGSVVNAYYLYFVLVNLLTLWLAYQSSLYLVQTVETTGERKQQQLAVLYAILYTFSAYRLVDLTTRFALGEAVALSFLPLVLAGFISIYFRDGKKWYWLAIGMSLICYTHLLSVFLTGLLLGIGLLVYFRQFNKVRLGQFLAAVGLALLLSLGSLGPLIEQMRSIDIASVHLYQLQEQAQSLGKLLVVGVLNRLGQQTIGLPIFFFLVVGLGVYFFKKTTFSVLGRQSLYWSLGLVLSLTTLFPWQLLQGTPLKNIQFPFRLTAYLVLFVCLFGVDLVKQKISCPMILGIAIALIGLNLVASAQSSWQKDHHGDYRNDYRLASDQAVRSSRRFKLYNNTDYFPQAALAFRGEKGGTLYSKTLILNGKDQPLPYQFIGGKTSFTVTTPQSQNQADLPLLYYKGLQAKVDGKIQPIMISKRGTVQVTLPQGTHRITVFYQPTIVVIASWLVSGVTLVGFGIWQVRKGRKHFVVGSS